MQSVIQYANNTAHWEEWQFEYKFGAFYIFPPTGVIESIDELRQTYDPTSSGFCQAHISLSEPLQAPLSEEQIQEIYHVLTGVKSFDIHYGALRSFPPYPGVCYSITPEDEFYNLRAALHATSVFAKSQLKREHVAPHITVAEFISLEQTQELLDELNGNVPEGSFHCHAVEYAVPNDNFYFERVLALPLGN